MLMTCQLQASSKADLEAALSTAQQGENRSQGLQQDVQRLQNKLHKLQVRWETCMHCAMHTLARGIASHSMVHLSTSSMFHHRPWHWVIASPVLVQPATATQCSLSCAPVMRVSTNGKHCGALRITGGMVCLQSSTCYRELALTSWTVSISSSL